MCCQDEYSEGLPLLEEALKNLSGMRYLKKKINLLYILSIAYYESKQIQLARQHCEQALQFATQLGIALAQECQELLSKIEEAENC